MLVELTGRSSGRVYKQQVSYAPDGEVLLTPEVATGNSTVERTGATAST
jgi:hypothetical protein